MDQTKTPEPTKTAEATETLPDLNFILELFTNSKIPMVIKESLWSPDSDQKKTVITFDLPFPKPADSDEPEATIEWIFKGKEIFDMNVYAQPGPPPDPLNPPESSYLSEFSARLGKPTEAPDRDLGYFK